MSSCDNFLRDEVVRLQASAAAAAGMNTATPRRVAPQGVDIEDALQIIEAEGGLGEWEDGDASGSTVERWLFPRFDGASDPGDMYLSRTGIGPYDSDVETVAGWLEAPRNIVGAILLLGEPGTGKTALVEAAVQHAGRTLTTILCTPDHTKDSLLLRFVGEGNGDNGTPFTLGPLAYAVKHGHTLYMDEYMLLVDGLKPITYSLADGRRYLPEGNVDGSPLEVHPDFRLILSSNPLVRGASLPEPVASRCASTTLTVETHASMLRDLGIAEAVVAAWESLGTQNLWRPQIRELRLADYWLGMEDAEGNTGAGLTQAISAFLPEHCPESDREAVRNTVMTFLGGSIRKDGRLVVS